MSESDLAIVLEILGRALVRRGVDGLAAWLISPRSDGRTPAEVLAAGQYDRARLLAVATTAAESERRRLLAARTAAEQSAPGAGGD